MRCPSSSMPVKGVGSEGPSSELFLPLWPLLPLCNLLLWNYCRCCHGIVRCCFGIVGDVAVVALELMPLLFCNVASVVLNYHRCCFASVAVDALQLLPSLLSNCCRWRFGIVAVVFCNCCRCCFGIVAVVVLALLPVLLWSCRWCFGIDALELLRMMRWNWCSIFIYFLVCFDVVVASLVVFLLHVLLHFFVLGDLRRIICTDRTHMLSIVLAVRWSFFFFVCFGSVVSSAHSRSVRGINKTLQTTLPSSPHPMHLREQRFSLIGVGINICLLHSARLFRRCCVIMFVFVFFDLVVSLLVVLFAR